MTGSSISKNDSKLRVQEQQQDALLTVSEVARRLRVEDSTVRRWIANGLLEAIPLPHNNKRRSYRIKQDTLDKLLKAPPV